MLDFINIARNAFIGKTDSNGFESPVGGLLSVAMVDVGELHPGML